MTLQTIRLELAREPGHPEGSRRDGYEFVAPLDQSGHFDKAEWQIKREQCRARRFWENRDDQNGLLIHTAKGDWAFSYDPTTDEDDEAIFRLDRHVLRPGEYVSISEPGGGQHTFRVISIHPAI